MTNMLGIFKVELFGITLSNLLLSFVILFSTFILRKVLVHVIIRKLKAFAGKTDWTWDEELIKSATPPLEGLVLTYGIWLAIKVLPQPVEPVNIKRFVDMTGHLLILLIGAWLLFRLTRVVDIVLRQKAQDPKHWLEFEMVPVIGLSLRILVGITAGIVIAQNMGYSVSGLIASLGLGGAALALASKDTLANLFGSMMIIIDKPFKVGDWIQGADFEGVVEEIGFRSTRIRTFEKTVESIPNNILANIVVANMDRRKDADLNVRRVKMTLGVTYATTADQMEGAVAAIKEILNTDEGVDPRMNRRVFFTDFGASSLDILVYYFSNQADWDYHLQVRERVNLKIMRKLSELGLQVAFPTRSLHIESLPPDWAKRD